MPRIYVAMVIDIILKQKKPLAQIYAILPRMFMCLNRSHLLAPTFLFLYAIPVTVCVHNGKRTGLTLLSKHLLCPKFLIADVL